MGGRVLAIGSIFCLLFSVDIDVYVSRSASSIKIGKFYGPHILDDFVLLIFLLESFV